MAQRNITGPISIHGGTAASMTANNPILADRELGVETDTRRMKLGNGSTRWGSLPYMGASSFTATISYIGWSNGSYTLNNANIEADSIGFLTIRNTATVAQYEAYANAKPYVTATNNGSITIKAADVVPTVSIPVTVILLN